MLGRCRTKGLGLCEPNIGSAEPAMFNACLPEKRSEWPGSGR
jgi:hypothetical protein